jgi:nicotinate-nucleotide adenylyltransferase
MRIGLFGGSFDPFHEGHRLVAMEAIRRLRLDRLWIMVTPGNPLKDRRGLAGLETRMAGVMAMMSHPGVAVTGFEARQGFTYSFETVSFLRARYPGTRFVWIMGGDSLSSLHRWERWAALAKLVPIAVYARPGSVLTAPMARAARRLGPYRIAEEAAATLADRTPPAWVYLSGTMSGQSSSAIRAARLAQRGSND